MQDDDEEFEEDRQVAGARHGDDDGVFIWAVCTWLSPQSGMSILAVHLTMSYTSIGVLHVDSCRGHGGGSG